MLHSCLKWTVRCCMTLRATTEFPLHWYGVVFVMALVCPSEQCHMINVYMYEGRAKSSVTNRLT